MRKIALSPKYLLLLPILALLTVVGIMQYIPLNNTLALGITVDLVLTVPLLYTLAIYHQNIPKTTVLPVLFLGVLLGSWFLPLEQQGYLNGVKTYVLPLIEVGVLSFVLYTVYQARNIYKQAGEQDFYSRLQQVTKALFPEQLSHFLATELSIPYYCFWVWKVPALEPQQFSYHKKSGSIALLGAFLMILTVEILALHVLLHLWSPWVAWIVTGLSAYTFLQVVSWMKSMPQRPIELTEKHLHLKYATVGEAVILLENIKQATPYEREKHSAALPRLSVLGELETPNIYLQLKAPTTLIGLLGRKQPVTELLFFVDEQKDFLQQLKEKLPVS